MATQSGDGALIDDGAEPAWTPSGPHNGRVLDHRSWPGSQEETIDLGGTWSFRLHPCDPDPLGPHVGGEEPVLDDHCENIDLPAHWVLSGPGRGHPTYTNVVYPFPLSPPHPPQDNPTADHWREFDLPDHWCDGSQVRLRFDGVESLLRVWVNGHWVGLSSGSRNPREFDVTDLVHPGRNRVTLRVNQFGPGTYLEDQDQWWLPGVFRDVTVHRLVSGAIEDLWVRTRWDPESAHGALQLRMRFQGPAPQWVHLEVAGPARRLALVPDGQDPQEFISEWVDIGPVRPWSPEEPVLHEVRVEAAGAERTCRAGFRHVEIQDGVLMANGHPLVLRGVNRHEIRPDAGRVFDEDFARADLALMKSFNVNALRTSHYPPHPRLLDLADEIGLWVVLESDIETHGFEGDGRWRGNPSDDPAWREAFLDRTRSAFERDKNHPSILMWSLGNESGDGVNLEAAAAWMRQRCPEAILHYEADRSLRYTDVHSRMYPTLEEVAAVLDESDPIAEVAVPVHPASRVDARARKRIRSAPYLLCEYLHAMGTGPGQARGYVDQFSHRRHCGGFVWEWRDHALWKDGPEGPTLAYGGDFGEEIHDGNFVCDGLVSATGEVFSGLVNWAGEIAPLRVQVQADPHTGALWSRVREPWGPAIHSELHLRWALQALDLDLADGVGAAGVTGVLPLPSHCGPEGVRIDLEEATVAFRQARAAHPGVAWAVHVVLVDERVPGAPLPAGPCPARIGDWLPVPVGFDDGCGRRTLVRDCLVIEAGSESGTRPDGPAIALGGFTVDEWGSLTEVAGLAIGPLELSVFRAPTDNDRGRGPIDHWGMDEAGALGQGLGVGGTSDAARWHESHLDLPRRRLVDLQDEGDRVLVEEEWGFPTEDFGAHVRLLYAAVPGGVRIQWEASPHGRWPARIPRCGLRLALPGTGWRARWVGTGPGIAYPDMSGASWPGVFEAEVRDMWERRVRPQEGGNRPGLRDLVLTGEGEALRLRIDAATLPSFSLGHWREQDLEGAAHWEDLGAGEGTWLWLDGGHGGLGTRSCGPDVRREAELMIAPLNITFSLRRCHRSWSRYTLSAAPNTR
ncbi:beta-galactosidase [Schaalia sp. 19OD2882]|uniref:glycoside hydrolase family 2 TIM barrel-domain containing protein n=1 Tax=Schaalia sp. 19OD2882 TaxID=2794089 RepID=UPI001C1ED434|nr:glycoside hydrolase family 2 TIM barrel-domain containing protein [Schaalia sp. 19OD2882]QWW19228.1 beta-galactosidase [Schaalia sp. 19OD2882]